MVGPVEGRSTGNEEQAATISENKIATLDERISSVSDGGCHNDVVHRQATGRQVGSRREQQSCRQPEH
jgi:hypothetical protein